MKRRNALAFEGYQKQAVEDILHHSITWLDFRNARERADKIPVASMQARIEQIARAWR
jgi:hypothetical protein